MVDYVTPIVLSLIAGAASGIGGLIGVYKRLSMKYFDLVIGFAAGVMLAVATLGLIEEGIYLMEGGSPAHIIAIVIISGVALGVFILLALDKGIPHLHTLVNSSDECEECAEAVCDMDCQCPNKDRWFECPYLSEEGKCKAMGRCFCPRKLQFQKKIKYSGILLAIGLTIHNAPEGIAMGVGFLAASALGISMTIAIALHNIPEGLAIAVPLMQAGPHGRDALGVLAGDVMGLAHVVAQMIQVYLAILIPLNQLPSSHANCSSGEATLVAVVRIVPKQCFAI